MYVMFVDMYTTPGKATLIMALRQALPLRICLLTGSARIAELRRASFPRSKKDCRAIGLVCNREHKVITKRSE